MNRITRHAVFAALAMLASLALLPAAAFFAGVRPDPDVITVQEYVNDLTGHYFLVSDALEKQAVDSGAEGAGWHPTGFQFSAYGATTGRAPGNVCRFYAPGPNSHFFTASPFECDLLRDHPELGWIYEGVRFEVFVPVNGACAANLVPVHRFYNNRAQFGDTNHRYSGDDATRAEMQAKGWIDEGIAFCANSWFLVPARTFASMPDAIRPLADCENEDLNHVGCVGLAGMAADLPNRIGPYFPPFFITTNPDWSNSFIDITGLYYDLYTAQAPQDQAAVAAHSFVQRPGSATTGFHVSSLDRGSGAIVSMDSVYQFATRAPVAGATDGRIAPFGGGLGHFIELSFGVNAKTVKRANPQSHAWGGPMIEFRDVRSGKSIDVTLQTFGTIPPADFVGVMEPATGNVFVSTVFRADPSFGSRVKGDFVPCAGNSPCVLGFFEFRIGLEDFARVIDMARASNPALSADPADYILVNFRFRGGVFNDAELGMTLDTLKLDIF
jgi:Repeat of unknown function (DUF5648)